MASSDQNKNSDSSAEKQLKSPSSKNRAYLQFDFDNIPDIPKKSEFAGAPIDSHLQYFSPLLFRYRDREAEKRRIEQEQEARRQEEQKKEEERKRLEDERSKQPLHYL